jgi:hypothetical protein
VLFNSEKELKKYMRKIYQLSEFYYQYKLEENKRFCILNRLNWKKKRKNFVKLLISFKNKKEIFINHIYYLKYYLGREQPIK